MDRKTRQGTQLPLPAAAAAWRETAALAAVDAPAERALHGLRILVVDDDVLMRVLAAEVLEGEGATVTTASNGAEAVVLCLSAGVPLDAVLIDREMPILGGLAATEAIRRQRSALALPIIGISSRFSPTDWADAMAAGMNDYLGKPFDAPLVITTLLRHCRPSWRAR